MQVSILSVILPLVSKKTRKIRTPFDFLGIYSKSRPLGRCQKNVKCGNLFTWNPRNFFPTRAFSTPWPGDLDDEADEDGRFTIRLYKKKPDSVEARDPDGKYDMLHVENVEPGTHNLVLELKKYSRKVELHVVASAHRILEAIEVKTCSAQNGRMISTKRFLIDSDVLQEKFGRPPRTPRSFFASAPKD